MTQPLAYGFEGEQRYGRFYRHSGKITVMGVVAGVAAGLIAALVGSWAYAYADCYIPIIYLNVLFAAAFGAGVGGAAAMGMRWGKVRNPPLALALVGLIALAAYYLCFAAWIFVVFQRYSDGTPPYFGMLLNPVGLWRLIEIVNEKGTWALGNPGSSSTHGGNENVSGVMLWIVWAGEFATIVGCALWTAKALLVDAPFCEACNAWAGSPKPLARLAPAANVDVVREQFRTRAWDELAATNLGANSGSHFWSLTHQRCGRCNGLHMLSVIEHRLTPTKKGKVQETKKALITRQLVSGEDVDALNIALAPPPPPPVAALPVTGTPNAAPTV